MENNKLNKLNEDSLEMVTGGHGDYQELHKMLTMAKFEGKRYGEVCDMVRSMYPNGNIPRDVIDYVEMGCDILVIRD